MKAKMKIKIKIFRASEFSPPMTKTTFPEIPTFNAGLPVRSAMSSEYVSVRFFHIFSPGRVLSLSDYPVGSSTNQNSQSPSISIIQRRKITTQHSEFD